MCVAMIDMRLDKFDWTKHYATPRNIRSVHRMLYLNLAICSPARGLNYDPILTRVGFGPEYKPIDFKDIRKILRV